MTSVSLPRSGTDGHIETYNREIERYGGPLAIEIVESIFGIDSDVVADFMQDSMSDNRELFAILSVKSIIDAFEFDKTTINNILVKRNHQDEYVGNRYREIKTVLTSLMNGDCPSEQADYYKRMLDLCEVFASLLRPETLKLKELSNSGCLSTPLEDICESIIHMHCNRLFGAINFEESRTRALLARAMETQSRTRNLWKIDPV